MCNANSGGDIDGWRMFRLNDGWSHYKRLLLTRSTYHMRLRAYITDAPSAYSEDTPLPVDQATAITKHVAAHPTFRLVGDHGGIELDTEPTRRWEANRILCPLLDDISDKNAEGLIVYSLGTLGLSAMELLKLVNQVAKLGGHLVSLADGLDSTTQAGLMTVRTLYHLSLCRPSVLRRKGTLSERPKKSRYLPFGWRLGRTSGPWERHRGMPDMEPVRNPTEQVILAEILEQCDGTGKSAYAIAKRLNGEGRRHPRLRKPWRAANIQAIYETASKYQQDAMQAMGEAAMGATA